MISPSGCFMKRQQLVWLFLSRYGCSAHKIPEIDWRNPFFFFSLSSVLHLISYLDGLSFYWNQSSLRSHWDRSCLDLHVGSLNLSLVSTETKAVWISVWVSTETKATLLRGVLWLSVFSAWSPGYRGKVGGQEGAEGFTPKSIPLGHNFGIFHREKRATHMLPLPTSFAPYRTSLIVKQYYT